MNEINQEARYKLTRARSSLILNHAFFGTIALRMRLVEDVGCVKRVGGAYWTNGEMLGYEPDVIIAESDKEVEFSVAHEVMHVAMAHPVRRKNRDPLLWNIAGDFAINQILESSGFSLADDVLLDEQFKGMSADEIYNKLKKKIKESKQKTCCGGLKDHPSRGAGRNGNNKKGKRNNGGSPSVSAAESKAMADVKILVAQAAAVAKSQGQFPADLERFVGELLHPKVNWVDRLRQFVEHSARNDYSWLKPNRRHLGRGIYLPSLHSQEIGCIVIAVDTSGSISQVELTRFATELSEILSTIDIEKVYVVYCDAKVAGTEEFDKTDLPIRLHAKGGGGTDFKPPFKWVEDNGIIPACFIYMTDMYCNSFPQEPEYPVMWASTSKREHLPPFGDLLDIS
ncbi:hypothetical protein LCGC14_0232740 [marine sediment metagenome]|uniref:Metallopeptidase domain-containing protein n=1 Tax=marine sediment metagenome TaxID=412755 RepID=A0A0F9XEF2_9ZZZZ